MAIAEQLDRLQRDLDQLKIEFNKFFGGALPTPPNQFLDRIGRKIRQLRSERLPGPVEQFRLTGLEARYNSLSELFGRRMREHEEGRTGRRAGAPTTIDPSQGIVDTDPEAAAGIAALHRRLYAEDEKVDLETFRAYIEDKADKIRGRTGCSGVRFRVVLDDGKPRLKARPVD